MKNAGKNRTNIVLLLVNLPVGRRKGWGFWGTSALIDQWADPSGAQCRVPKGYQAGIFFESMQGRQAYRHPGFVQGGNGVEPESAD